MKIHDISVTIKNGVVHYPGSTAVEVALKKSMERGDSGNTSSLSCSAHTATHVDAPFHFIQDGMTIPQLDLSTLMGTARVAALDVEGEILPKHLETLDLKGVERLLFKTRNSNFMYEPEFREDYTHFGVPGSQFLVSRGIKLVGIDYITVEAYGVRGAPAHKVLLGSGMIILEGIDLRAIEPGDYQLICLPLKLEPGDGAPARAVLVEPDA